MNRLPDETLDKLHHDFNKIHSAINMLFELYHDLAKDDQKRHLWQEELEDHCQNYKTLLNTIK